MNPAGDDIDIDRASAWASVPDSGGGSERPPAADAPATIGRYEVIEHIGGGAMGIVYAARDPELSRTVAIKVLGRAGSPTRGERLRREAQALAQLSHENVVSVYDVGLVQLDDGEDRVYIAMQFVEGTDLAAHLRARRDERRTRRRVRDIVALFAQAGRGLAAAHAAGLVHRDFKPANVLIGTDGVVRVADFGLARATASGGERLADARHEPAEPRQLLDTMTAHGLVAGTPPYMAPEQFVGDDVDARTDQFAFCVALYEALYGQRPFEGGTLAALRRNVTRGRVRPAPRDARVPARLRRIVLRGLSVDPDRRHPDMTALVRELSRDRLATMRRAVLPAAAVIAIAASVAVVAAGGDRDDPRCTLAASRLQGVWDDPARAQMRAAFRDTGRDDADVVFDQVSRRLDDHFGVWVAAHTATCEATHVRGDQSAAVLDLRMRCLDRRLSEAAAVVDLLAAPPDAKLVDRALGLVAGLPGPERCADVDALRAVVPPPAGEDERARLAELDRRLDDISALQEGGQFERALAGAIAAVDRARELDYAPSLARALFLRASLEDKSAAFDAAEQSYYDAATAAGAARDDRLAAAVLIGLVTLVGDRLRRHDDAMMLAHLADAAVERAGGEPALRAELHNARGKLLNAMGDYPGAEREFSRALTIREDALGPGHPDVARTLNNLAVAVYRQGRLSDAEPLYRRAIASAEDVLGPHHPHLAAFLSNLGSALAPLGRREEAQSLHERALDIRARALGPAHPHVANSLGNLGNLARDRGDLDAALDYYQRTLDIDRAALGDDHPELGKTLTDIGDVHRARGDGDAALDCYQRAIELFGALGPDHPNVGRPLTGASLILLARGDRALAAERARRAVAVLEAHAGDPAELAAARTALEAASAGAP